MYTLFEYKTKYQEEEVAKIKSKLFQARAGYTLRKSEKSYHYYTWLIGAVANQEPRKTIGYCLENNRLYCFSNPRWPPQISTNQEVN